MATMYEQIYDARNSATFQKQVTVALMAAALAVLSEDAATPDHAARLRWAQTLRNNADYVQSCVSAMLWRVMSDVRIYGALATYTDATVTTVVQAFVPEVVATFVPF